MTRAQTAVRLAREEAVARLAHGIGLDLAGYRELGVLLERQFEAALAHRAQPLRELADAVVAQVESIETRLHERRALVRALAGDDGTVEDAIAAAPAARRAAMASGWRALARLVRDCKQRNGRNAQLLMDQHAIMQRVLHGEEPLYAPA